MDKKHAGKGELSDKLFMVPRLFWQFYWGLLEKPRKLYDDLCEFMLEDGYESVIPIQLTADETSRIAHEKEKLTIILKNNRRFIAFMLVLLGGYFLILAVLHFIADVFAVVSRAASAAQPSKAKEILTFFIHSEMLWIIGSVVVVTAFVIIALRLRYLLNGYVYSGTEKLLEILKRGADV